MQSGRCPTHATASAQQVRPHASGWLLLLCWMLVVIGPLISAYLVVTLVQSLLAPGARGATSIWLVAAGVLSALLTGWALVRGVGAGLQLWRLRPGALLRAKAALLLGLAAEVVDTGVGVVMAGTTPGVFIGTAVWQAMPGLVFFVLAFGYLQHSARVRACFPNDAP